MIFSSTKKNNDNTRGLYGGKISVAKLMLLLSKNPWAVATPDTVATNKSDWSG